MDKSVLVVVMFSAMAWLTTPALAAPFSFSTGNPDGRLGALSQPAGGGSLETETADDFLLGDTTVIEGATIEGLITSGASLSDITNVEVEVYHVFPTDSVNVASGNVPTRKNSPSDVEIGSATRDQSRGTLSFAATLVNSNLSVPSSVVNQIKKFPNQATHGDGPAGGAEVQIVMTFTPPIVLPANQYFFRPQVTVDNGQFLYLSAPKPIVAPGTPFSNDLQAWIRNSELAPDWLRIGTDIIAGATPPVFNMVFSLNGETVPQAGLPGKPNCHGRTVSALAHQFGGIDAAAATLGFSSVQQLQDTFEVFCN